MSDFGMDRRSVLLGAGLLSLSGAKAIASPSSDKRLRWAVVGLGTFAVGQMMPAFAASKEAVMTAFVSGHPEKAREQGARYHVTRFYDYGNFDQIASDPDIDCVYIALPVALHAEYTIRALKAGKHVLCEKPMASTVAECEAMIAAAKAVGRQLGVAYRIHFEPNNADVIRRLQAGEIGVLRHVSGDAGFNADPNFPPHKWRLQKAMAGGGSMYDIGIYALNACLWAAGADPVSVSGVYSTPANDPRFTEVEGGVEWRLRFASGISAQGSSSYAYQYHSRHTLFGSAGNIIMSPSMDYNNIKVTLGRSDFTSQALQAGNAATQFGAQIDGFCQAVRAGRPHATPGEMGLRDVKLIQAIYQSADAGGAIVKV